MILQVFEVLRECHSTWESVEAKCKTREISYFWKKGKIIISVKNPKCIL